MLVPITMEEDYGNNSKEFLMSQYGETAKRCEDLERKFSDLPITEALNMYRECLSDIQVLCTLESDPFFIRSLEVIKEQMIWQEHCCKEVTLTPRVPDVTEIPPLKKKLMQKDARSAERHSTIQSTRRTNLGSGLEDVAGLESVKKLLRKSVLLPMTCPSLFTGGRKPWSQILLFGPPGTGKSKIAAALASEVKAQFYVISSADLLSSWVGESEKMIKDLFEYTRTSTEKCIVFIDEIDSVCRIRTTREGDHTRSMKNQLLLELDNNLSQSCNSFVLCATNCPWDIDTAFMRRFQQRIYIPLPDRRARLKIMMDKCEGVQVDMTSPDWEDILDRTEGYSGSDLINVTTCALQEPLEEVESNHTWVFTKEGKWMPCPSNTLGAFHAPLSAIPAEKIAVRSVCRQDFQKAVDSTPKTILQSDIDKYTQFTSQKQ